MRNKGFTLVELLVVMALIAVLSVLILGAIQITRLQGSYTEARSEMRDIRALMDTYLIKFGQLPPSIIPTYTGNGDHCSACFDPPAGYWTHVINDMKDKGLLDSTIAERYYSDPWGNPYGFDDNYGSGTVSIFCSAGPDKRRGNNGVGSYGTGDDICANITHEQVRLW